MPLKGGKVVLCLSEARVADHAPFGLSRTLETDVAALFSVTPIHQILWHSHGRHENEVVFDLDWARKAVAIKTVVHAKNRAAQRISGDCLTEWESVRRPKLFGQGQKYHRSLLTNSDFLDYQHFEISFWLASISQMMLIMRRQDSLTALITKSQIIRLLNSEDMQTQA